MEIIKEKLYVESFTQLFQVNEDYAKQINELTFYPKDLDDADFTKLWKEFKKFKNIDSIMIYFDSCSEIKNVNNLNYFMKKMIKLTKLIFSFRFVESLDEQSICEIIESLQGLSNLSHLYLDFYGSKNIQDKHISNISRIVQDIHSLQSINLQLGWNKNISNLCIPDIVSTLQKQNMLVNLDLSFHYLKNLTDLGQFGQAIGQLVELRLLHLQFGNCINIPDKDFNNLFASLQHLKNLIDLYIGINNCKNLTDESIIQLGRSIGHFSKLQELLLDFGQLKINNIEQFGEIFFNLTELITFHLSAQYLNSQNGILNNKIGNMRNLKNLYIDLQGCGNQNEEYLIQFFMEFINLTNLTSLDLIFNNCYWISLNTIEIFVKQLKDLKSLLFLSIFFEEIDDNIQIELSKSLLYQNKVRFLYLRTDCQLQRQNSIFLRLKYLINFEFLSKYDNKKQY